MMLIADMELKATPWVLSDMICVIVISGGFQWAFAWEYEMMISGHVVVIQSVESLSDRIRRREE